MSTLPVHNPSLPYLGKIPGGLSHGVMIRIRGNIAHVVTKFIQINVQTGPALGPNDDINMHLSIRPDQNVIVRNHMKNQFWGTEERIGGCPIARGQFVEILILAQSNCFKVAINGKHFCEFNHRLPLNSAQFIYVAGEMTIESITMGGDSPPSAPPMPLPTPMTSESYHTPSYQPMHQQMIPPYTPMHQQNMTPPYTPMHQQIGGYRPPPYSYPSLQTQNMPPYQSSTASPSSNYPTHSPYPNYPSSGGTFHTPYGNQTATYGQQPPYIQQQHLTTSATQPYYQNQTSTYYENQPTITTTKPKNNTALKYAAGIGGIGLGAYVLSKAFQSDSDSD